MAENPQKNRVECLQKFRPRLIVGITVGFFTSKSVPNSVQKSVRKSVQKICPKNPSKKFRPKNPSKYPCHFVIAIVLIGFVSARPVLKMSHQASTYSWAHWPATWRVLASLHLQQGGSDRNKKNKSNTKTVQRFENANAKNRKFAITIVIAIGKFGAGLVQMQWQSNLLQLFPLVQRTQNSEGKNKKKQNIETLRHHLRDLGAKTFTIRPKIIRLHHVIFRNWLPFVSKWLPTDLFSSELISRLPLPTSNCLGINSGVTNTNLVVLAEKPWQPYMRQDSSGVALASKAKEGPHSAPE